ncbi:MAG TPA: response regulator transcription factor [Ktedonobacteraceae bacterium]|jgi:CheY-like chemotaxis protein
MRKKILVVEDDAAIGDVLYEMLSDAGYAVELQMDGQAALQIHEPFPDLLFLDIRLSGSDGRTICQYIKAKPATRHIPIILLSTYKDMQRIAKDVGADDFLTKPFEMEDVLALVTNYLGGR